MVPLYSRCVHQDIDRWLSISPSHDRLLSVILAAQDVS